MNLGVNNTKLTAQLDAAVEANRQLDRELDQQEAARALRAAMDDAVTRYLRRVVPTEESK